MSFEPNSYQSPLSAENSAGATEGGPLSREALVSRGRLICLAILLLLILAQLGAPLAFGKEPSPILLLISSALFLGVWHGYGGAIAIMGLGFALGALYTFASLVGGAAQGEPPLALSVDLAVSILYVVAVLALLFSPSLNAFFRHQRELRHPTSAPEGDGPPSPDTPEEPELPDGPADRLVTLATYNLPFKAEAERLLLEQEGIEVFFADDYLVGMDWFLANAVGGAKLQVAAADANRALKILREHRRAMAKPERDAIGEEVTFACQECGRPITFPGRFRGKVETCRHCGEFVDVPE